MYMHIHTHLSSLTHSPGIPYWGDPHMWPPVSHTTHRRRTVNQQICAADCCNGCNRYTYVTQSTHTYIRSVLCILTKACYLRQQPKVLLSGSVYASTDGSCSAWWMWKKLSRFGFFLLTAMRRYSEHDLRSELPIIIHLKDTIPKIRNKYSQERNCGATVPVPTFMLLWVIYTFLWSVCLFCCRKIGGPNVGIYRISLTDTWMWNLGLRPRNSFAGTA